MIPFAVVFTIPDIVDMDIFNEKPYLGRGFGDHLRAKTNQWRSWPVRATRTVGELELSSKCPITAWRVSTPVPIEYDMTSDEIG